VFPIEKSAANLCCAVLLRASEKWALRRYLVMALLEAMNRGNRKDENNGRGN